MKTVRYNVPEVTPFSIDNEILDLNLYQRRIKDFPWFSSERDAIYYLAKIRRKLHENEQNWTGGPSPNFFYVDPPLLTVV